MKYRLKVNTVQGGYYVTRNHAKRYDCQGKYCIRKAGTCTIPRETNDPITVIHVLNKIK